MRVAIDASAVARAKRTGIANYTMNVIEHLAEVAPDVDFVLCYRLSRWKRRKHFLETSSPNLSRRVIVPGLDWLSQRGVQVFHGPDARLPEGGLGLADPDQPCPCRRATTVPIQQDLEDRPC